MRAKVLRLLVALAATSVIAAGCGDDDTDASAGDTDTEAEEAAATTDLADICPSPIVVQTDWFPSPEHAYLYRLTGGEGTVDVETGVYTGPLLDTGVDLEIRSGGPYLGFQATTAIMYQDPDIHLGYISLDEAVQNAAELPTVAVMAPLEINPQILMWDPAVHTFESFADIGAGDATVNYFGGATYMDYLVATGQIRADQADGSYDGTPARFVVEGDLVQQGFATSEPYRYENELDDWGKPVDFLLVHDSGWEIYSQMLSARPEVVDEFAACWEAVIPVIQQSVVDHTVDPDPANQQILAIVEELATTWELSAGQMQYSVDTALELGVYGNGPNGTVGDLDPDRVATFVETAIPVLDGVPADLDPASLYTNDFIDTAIGF
ncbi:MAG TPA: hypothetical protein VK866_08945 [Acidimicrobiales bacterium]|nr:hypothetical protein [Acidimicrobiales bacterium]